MRLWQNWQHYSVGALECSARKVKRCPEGSFPQFSKERLSNAFKSYEPTVIKILSHRVPNTTKLTFEKLFQEQNQYDAKLVHLVRDPRGVVYSRVKLGWMKKNFNSPEFRKSVRNVFDPILQNIRLGLFSCPSWLRGRFKVVRYEDLVANMVNVTRDLYNFAGMGWSSNVVNKYSGQQFQVRTRLFRVTKRVNFYEQWRVKSVKGSGNSTFLQKDQLCYLKRAEKLTFCIHFS